MAITGNYLSSNAYTGARKWGTGINPVHWLTDPNEGRPGKPIHTGTGPNGSPSAQLPENLLDDTVPEYGYTDEDFSSAIWGYGYDTGTADRPGLGISTEDSRGSTKNFPSRTQPGPPSGDSIRRLEKGAQRTNDALVTPSETVSEGWRNKTVDSVNNARVSDPSQYEMQTSMTQRDKVREGSQRGAGSASEYTAPIGSYRPTWGMRLKPWSGKQRHYDMTPRVQDDIPRPFWYRQAGTGYVEWMRANEAFNYQVHPLQRQPVPDPYAGFPIPAPGNVFEEESSDVNSWVNVWY
jgi:hypothetical protein